MINYLHWTPLPVQEAGKVCVQAFISADQLIAEGQSRHEATLLQPEDGTETVCVWAQRVLVQQSADTHARLSHNWHN